MRYTLIFLFTVLLSGCGARMVEEPGTYVPSEYAPEEYKEQEGEQEPGHVYYLNEGLGFVREMRREDAMRQMHDACDGNYSIINVASNTRDIPVELSAEGMKRSNMAESNYVHYHFLCY